VSIARPIAEHKWRVLSGLTVLLVFLVNGVGGLAVSVEIGTNLALHGAMLRSLLAGGPLPSVLGSLDFLVLTAAGGVLALGLPCLSPLRACVLTALVASVPFGIELLMPNKAYFIPFQYTLLVILVLFVLNILLSWLQETRQRQRLLGLFGQYVPPEVVAGLSTSREPPSMEGQAREMSVLFCDIKGFTRISESMPPRDLALLLNHYFTAMTEVIYRHDGTVDKYIGDAIMAFWGAPVAQTDHAGRALAAALEMQAALASLRDGFRGRGWPAIAVGIGINSGTMSVGNMGSRYRVAYTVVGDAVNLAARLENLTRGYEVELMVSDGIRRAAAEWVFRELDNVRVKGKGEATRVFEPVARREALSQTDHQLLEHHEQALGAYYGRDFAHAAALFGELAGRVPERRVYYGLMQARCLGMSREPPPRDWDGSIQAPSY